MHHLNTQQPRTIPQKHTQLLPRTQEQVHHLRGKHHHQHGKQQRSRRGDGEHS